MNPKALAYYWTFSVMTFSTALAYPQYAWIPMALFFAYFVYSITD